MGKNWETDKVTAPPPEQRKDSSSLSQAKALASISLLVGSVYLCGLGIPLNRKRKNHLPWGKSPKPGIGVGGATLHGTCVGARAASWTSRGRSPPNVVGLLVKGCHWPWMLGLSVWKGLRMRITSKPDWSASFCTSVAISSTDLQWMLSSRTAPLTGRRRGWGRGSGWMDQGSDQRKASPAHHAALQPRPDPLTVFGHYSGHTARPRVHVYYDPWVPSGEVGHLPFHELPEEAEKSKHSDL